MQIKTHHKIDRELCGTPLETSEGYSRVELVTKKNMAVDESGLVHGGFIFGQADFAAMIAVNHPYVVLGGADVKFKKPVKAGDKIIAEAKIKEVKGGKNTVYVVVTRGDQEVFEGTFICFVLEHHVMG